MYGKWQQERRRYPGSWRRARMLFCWFRTTFSRRFIPARFSTFLTSCDARSDRAMRCHRTFARYSSEACPSCSIFPGNTKKQRVWFRAPFEQADVEHELHFMTGPTTYANANSRIAASTFRLVVRRRRLPTSMRSRLT